jgi:orotate phosphoribosyltransferase
MNHRIRLRDLLVARSLRRGDFVLASGARSSYYIDARRTLFSAEGQYLVGHEALRVIREAGLKPRWVGGLTMGADPVACAVAHRSWIDGDPVDAFSVRKAAEGPRRRASRIEGGLPAGAPVVVVEDTLTTGGSALRAAEALEEHGARILAVLTVVDREAGGEEALRGRRLPPPSGSTPPLLEHPWPRRIPGETARRISPPAEGA